MIQCKYCGKAYTKKGIGPHLWRTHGEGKNWSPTPKGTRPWNKGLTKEQNESLQKASYKLSGRASFKGKKHSEESKQKISRALSINNRGGRCKWYKVGDALVQGTWERDLAEKMEELGVAWEKIKTNSYTFEYHLEDKKRHYTPDFYLQEWDLFLEVKGYWHGSDKRKMKKVIEENQLDNIFVIEKNLMQELLKCNTQKAFIDILGRQ